MKIVTEGDECDDVFAALVHARAGAHQQCIEALASSEVEAVMAALDLLARLLGNEEATEEETGQLCTALRESGSIERLVALLGSTEQQV